VFSSVSIPYPKFTECKYEVRHIPTNSSCCSNCSSILICICSNAANCIMKFGAWLYTGSHSMFSEFIHSLADTANQVLVHCDLPCGHSKGQFLRAKAATAFSAS